MNIINKSTGFSPFQLHTGYSLRLIPPVTQSEQGWVEAEDVDALRLIEQTLGAEGVLPSRHIESF